MKDAIIFILLLGFGVWFGITGAVLMDSGLSTRNSTARCAQGPTKGDYIFPGRLLFCWMSEPVDE